MNTAPKSLDQILARNVRLALGPYNDDDRPITELIVQLRNKLTALAPPSGEGADASLLLRDPRNFRPVAWEHQCSGGRCVLSYIENDERIENVQRVRPLLYSDTIRALIDATTPQSATADGDSSDLGEVRFPAKGGVWGYGA